MNNHKTSFFPVLLLLCLILPPPIHTLDPLFLEIKIKGLTEAGPPERIAELLLFTYQPDHPVRTMGLRFEHENYTVFHTYMQNQNRIFFYLYNIPEGLTDITYRICVDGIWMHDPANPNRKQDITGLIFSRVRLGKMVRRALSNPAISAGGEVGFAFKTLPGSVISIIGDFNHWDPFADKLTEVEPGLYRITLKLLPGRHYYLFVVNGERLIDPYNLESVVDHEDFRYSTFYLPPTPTR